jgi:hypothetical protein
VNVHHAVDDVQSPDRPPNVDGVDPATVTDQPLGTGSMHGAWHSADTVGWSTFIENGSGDAIAHTSAGAVPPVNCTT